MVKQLIAESQRSITLINLCESTRWKKDKDIVPNKKTVIYQAKDLSYAATESTVEPARKTLGSSRPYDYQKQVTDFHTEPRRSMKDGSSIGAVSSEF